MYIKICRRGIVSLFDRERDENAHNMPVSANALCNIVSFTAAKTNRMFDVSVAWVRLGNI